MAPSEPSIGRIVIYRGPDGVDVPAIITATVDAGLSTRLSSAEHVDLVCLSAAGERGGRVVRGRLDVPLFEPYSTTDPRPGSQPVEAPVPAGTWRWPVMR